MAGWSSIRIKSAKELRKNPNAYFYRHVAPHEHQVCPLPHRNCTSSIMPAGCAWAHMQTESPIGARSSPGELYSAWCTCQNHATGARLNLQ